MCISVYEWTGELLQVMLAPMDSRFITSPRTYACANAKRRTIDILLPELSILRVGKKLERNSTIAFSSNSRSSITTISPEINQSKEVSPNTSSVNEGIASNSMQFGLLMENLNAIEDMLGDKSLVMLEKNILEQIKHLDDESLKKNLESSSWAPSERQNDEVIIRTGKIEERKLKRIKSLDKRVSEMAQFKFPTKIDKMQKWMRRMNNSVSLSDAELAEGIKAASELEKLREQIETETGRPVSHNVWAKAAKIDRKTLSQQLIFGGYCRNKITKNTKPLVMFLIKKFKGLGIAYEDLLQVGSIGVLRGAEKFDRKRGYKFATYIRYWIRKAVYAHIAEFSRPFSLSLRAEAMVQKIEKAGKELHINLGRYPNDEELAKFTDMPLNKIRLARRCSRSVVSFEKCLFVNGSPVTFEDITEDASLEVSNKYMMTEEVREGILCILDKLDAREKQIIVQRYGIEDGSRKTLEQMGKTFGVSKEWIRKIEKRAIAKLRNEDIQNEVRKLLSCK